MEKIVMVLPTYNEAENIEKFINALREQFEKIQDYEMQILVVDDFSPDKTGEIAKNMRVEVLQKEKEGLGAAYVYGFEYAINTLNANYIVEMDSDFSHKPEDLPRLIAEIKNGANFIIGSRYVSGGSIPSNWGVLRKLNSKFGNIFARYVAGLANVKDCTSGFRILDVNLLKEIDLKNIGASGYSFQMNILHAMLKKGAKVAEVPIHFVDREFGQSKLRINDIIEFMLNSIRLRFKSN